MALNPCPCTNLQKGSMVLAIIDAVLSMLNLGLMILALVVYINEDDDDERTVGLVVVSIVLLICILQILLAFRLYSGARSKDLRNCRIWLLITAVITGINVANFILNVSASEFNGSSIGGALVNILYKLYEMLVVYSFIKALKLEMQMGVGVGYVMTAQPQPPPLHQQTYYNYSPDNAAQIYVTPQSQAYPMQQFGPPPPYPTPPSSAYPAPVHHVTTTTIS